MEFVTIGATWFDQHVANLIACVVARMDTEINVGSAHLRGVKTEATLRPLLWRSPRATCTLLATTSVGQPASEDY